MTVGGRWEKDKYIPEPSVEAYEKELAKLIGLQKCASCGKPLGNSPRTMYHKRQYHPSCFVLRRTRYV